jgi:hypothetical protein
MKRVEDSLDAYARIRVSVSIDERVMAQVRKAAGQRRERARPSARQAFVLMAAALGAVAVEMGGWIGTVSHLQPPRLAPYSHALLQVLFVTLQLLKVLHQCLEAIVSAAEATLNSPPGLALVLGVLLSSGLLMAARQKRRPAAARGLR